ncbi:hypothetical protein GCM10010199_20210 [Dactylosporangium roseum]
MDARREETTQGRHVVPDRVKIDPDLRLPHPPRVRASRRVSRYAHVTLRWAADLHPSRRSGRGAREASPPRRDAARSTAVPLKLMIMGKM